MILEVTQSNVLRSPKSRSPLAGQVASLASLDIFSALAPARYDLRRALACSVFHVGEGEA